MPRRTCRARRVAARCRGNPRRRPQRLPGGHDRRRDADSRRWCRSRVRQPRRTRREGSCCRLKSVTATVSRPGLIRLLHGFAYEDMGSVSSHSLAVSATARNVRSYVRLECRNAGQSVATGSACCRGTGALSPAASGTRRSAAPSRGRVMAGGHDLVDGRRAPLCAGSPGGGAPTLSPGKPVAPALNSSPTDRERAPHDG